LIVIEDAAELTAAVPKWAEHFCWADIEEELGANAWIIARRSAAIRSFGLLKAWQHQRPFMITMDDDCLPESDQAGAAFFRAMTAALNRQWSCDSWWNTMRGDVYPRGYPYAVRDCVQETILHHGLWSNVADLDAQTQRELPHYRTMPAEVIERIPTGALFPMSSMNLAFKRKAVPLLFFLLMGEDAAGNPIGYDRFDDIWAGMFFKKIADHQGWAVSSGSPSVHHARASNIDVNLARESAGLAAHEWLWRRVRALPLRAASPLENYREIAMELRKLGGYWARLSDAMMIWSSLFACDQPVHRRPDLAIPATV
jgi:hypothetical protein